MYQLTQTIGYGVGATGILIGLYLILSHSSDEISQQALVPLVGIDSVGLSLGF